MASKAPAKTDAIALLEADHKRVKALFKEAEGIGERAYSARAKLFEQIDRELTIHTKVEEEIFYPAVKAKTSAHTEPRDDVWEAYEEHAGAKELIGKLEDLDPKDETYKAKLNVLMEQVTHHVKEEESHFFPECRKLLSRDELNDLGARILQMKEAQGAA